MSKGYVAAEATQGRIIIARLKPGQEIVAALIEIIEQYQVQAGYIPTLLGGFKKVKLGSMEPSNDPSHPIDIETEYTEPVDYLGTGTIAQRDGKPSLHVHLTAAGSELKGITGHLISGEVVFLTEVVIVELAGVTMGRKEDPEVFNLPLLDL